MSKKNIDPVIIEKAEHAYDIWLKSAEINKAKTMWRKATAFVCLISCKLKRLPTHRWCDDNGQHRLGETNGEVIYVRNLSEILYGYAFFHEVGHVLLHFKPMRQLVLKEMEREADLFALTISTKLWPEYTDILKNISSNNPNNIKKETPKISKYQKAYRPIIASDTKTGTKLLYKISKDNYLPVVVVCKTQKNITVHMDYSEQEELTVRMPKLFIKI